MKNKQGFTLVELLVVIAIIGILSTVAVVNLNSARDKAKEAAVKSWVTSLTSAAILCDDNNGALGNPMVSGAYDPTHATAPDFCSTVSDLAWPATLPTGYDTVVVTDGTTGDGIWEIEVSAEATLDGYECAQSGCSILNATG